MVVPPAVPPEGVSSKVIAANAAKLKNKAQAAIMPTKHWRKIFCLIILQSFKRMMTWEIKLFIYLRLYTKDRVTSSDKKMRCRFTKLTAHSNLIIIKVISSYPF